jgi:glycolate oxidase FAD binding subunit
MSGLGQALRQLEAVVGEQHLLTSTEAVSHYGVDAQRPVAVALPGSADEVAGLLRAASRAGLSVLVWGAGHHMYLGAVPGPIGVVLSLTRLTGIVEYDAENLTVSAEAGVTLDQLQKVVGERGQMLALDPPGPTTATIGGIAAANLAGPLRMRWGAPRDLAIGLRVVLADGTMVKTGGKTVKNVAGYNLTKLFVGSHGTLGVISEITLRLTPIPEAEALLAAAVGPPAATSLARELLASRLDISSLDILNHEAARAALPSLPVTLRPEAHVMLVGLLGAPEAIDRQEREIRALSQHGWARLNGADADEVRRASSHAASPGPAAETITRLALPMARIADALELVSSGGGWWAAARAGDGLLYSGPVTETDISEVTERLTVLREWTEGRGGSLVLESGPVEVKRAFPVWGEGLPNLDLMRRLKERYDPNRTLGCGRFLPGL